MADVKWSNNSEFVPQASLGSGDHIMGLTGVNVNAKYPVSIFVNSSTNKENAIYVSKLGNDTTGTGTFNNPYLTCLKANSVAIENTTIYVDAGTYAESDFLFKPNVNWVSLTGPSRDLVHINMSTAALDTAAWTAATNPYLYFSNLTLNFTTFNFQPSSLKSGSKYRFHNCAVTGTANLRLVAEMRITNSAFTTLNAYWIQVTESRNSKYSTLLAIRAGLILQVNSIVFNSDGDWLTGVSVLNDVDGTLITAKFTNAMNQMTGLTIDMNSQDSTIFYSDIVSIALPNLISIVNPGSASPIFPVEETRLLTTGHGFANYTDHNNNFWYGGSTGTTAHTLVMGRNIGGDVAVSDAVVFGFASCDKTSTFTAWDFSNPVTRGQAAQIHQFVAKYANGIGFQTDDPQANFHVKAATTGGLLLSANAQISSGNVSAGELNPTITTTSLIFYGKYTGGGTFTYDLSSLSGYVLTSTNQSIEGTKSFLDPTLIFEVQNPLVTNKTAVPITTNSGTLTAAQLTGGIIVFTPTANATWQVPTASDIEGIIGDVSLDRGFDVLLVNDTAFTVSITVNTGVTFGGLTTSGTLTLSAFSSNRISFAKSAETPAYVVFGSSYGSLSHIEQNYSHTTNWTGIWASDQAGNVNLTRIGDQVFMTLPVVSALTNAASVITNTSALPTQFRPSANIRIGVPSIINSAISGGVGNGATKLSSAGILTIYQSGADSNFPSGQTCGFDRQTLNWSIV